MTVSRILVFDPGESTGWCYYVPGEKLRGGTLPKNHQKVWGLISELNPDVIVFERFNLYPGRAKSLAWNTFYPCEVIGVIRLWTQISLCECFEQAPSVKKYAGEFGQDFSDMDREGKLTEHVKDAYQHLKYFLRNNPEYR